MEEIWKDIPGYEGLYQVNPIGIIKSLFSYRNQYGSYRKEKILKNYLNNGYHTASLNNKNERVHRLVAKAFIPNPDNKPEVNHINGIRNDNRVENLEWVTSSENQIHSYNILKQKKGMLGRTGKLNKKSKPILQFDLDGEFIREWDNRQLIKKELGICSTSVYYCCIGKNGITSSRGFIWKWKYNYISN